MSLERDIVQLHDALNRETGRELLELENEVYFFNFEVVEATREGAAHKIVSEATELLSDVLEGEPTLGEEADVLITLIGEVVLAGRSMTDVIDEARRKMHVNIHERTWVKQPDGSYQHVRRAA